MRQFRIISLLILFTFHYLNGQNLSFSQIHIEAKKLYNKGNFEAALSQLSTFKPNQLRGKYDKFRYHYLASLIYYELHSDSLLNISIVKFLNADPQYQQHPNLDRTGFKKTLTNYLVKPKSTIGLGTAILLNNTRSIHNYTATNGPTRYPVSPGFQMGIQFSYFLYPSYRIDVSPAYQFLQYSATTTNEYKLKNHYAENMNYFHLPVSISRKVYFNRHFILHATLGMHADLLFSSFATGYSAPVPGNSPIPYSTETTAERTSVIYGIQTGASLSLPVQNNELRLTAILFYNFNQLNNASFRFANRDFILNTSYISNDLKNYYIALAISYNFVISYRIIHSNSKKEN
jgi:hypothetical protein